MADAIAKEETQKLWAGGELLLYAAAQLALVAVAYRIDRQHRPPLISTASWAILLGLVVRSSFCHQVLHCCEYDIALTVISAGP